MKKAIICDIDGTLVDSYPGVVAKNLALTMGKTEKEAWQKFTDYLPQCAKHEWCYRLLEGLIQTDITILYITGRDEVNRKVTLPFLKLSKPYNYELHMRPTGRTDEDANIKHEILETLTEKYDILFAIDDRISNCRVYSQFGIQPLLVLDSIQGKY